MKKHYSLTRGDFSRVHPMALVGIIALLISFFTSGAVKVIGIVVFTVMLFFVLGWLYHELKGE
jgi:hypothetical protein